MKDAQLPHAVTRWLDQRPHWTSFTTREIMAGVSAILGHRLSDREQASARCQLERHGHDNRMPSGARYRVLFAETKHGLVPARTWIKAGGAPQNRTKGNYIRVPEGSRDIVCWWEQRSWLSAIWTIARCRYKQIVKHTPNWMHRFLDIGAHVN